MLAPLKQRGPPEEKPARLLHPSVVLLYQSHSLWGGLPDFPAIEYDEGCTHKTGVSFIQLDWGAEVVEKGFIIQHGSNVLFKRSNGGEGERRESFHSGGPLRPEPMLRPSSPIG